MLRLGHAQLTIEDAELKIHIRSLMWPGSVNQLDAKRRLKLFSPQRTADSGHAAHEAHVRMDITGPDRDLTATVLAGGTDVGSVDVTANAVGGSGHAVLSRLSASL